MQYELGEGNSIAELPAKNIDTGMGLERMAAILQNKRSVFEIDMLWPLIELGKELSGANYDETLDDAGDDAATKAMRILANHSRSMAFLIADGVVPSNEDRGYVVANETGGHLHPNVLCRRYAALIDRAKVPAIRFHDLRHMSATLLLAEGVRGKIVQERLGHANVAMTLDLYSQVTADMQKDAADRVGAIRDAS